MRNGDTESCNYDLLTSHALPFVLQNHRVPYVPKLKKPSFRAPPPKPADRIVPEPASHDDLSRFHLLLPASNPDVNLCKTLLTASVLGYPVPTLMSWNETYNNGRFASESRSCRTCLGNVEQPCPKFGSQGVENRTLLKIKGVATELGSWQISSF